MTYLAPQPKTVSPDWSWAGEQGCFWFWLFAQHLCGSQDSWALNKCFGWCFPFYANSSNGQCTSMGGFHITWQLLGKSTHPLSFQDPGHFYSSCWQGGNIGNNEVCCISFVTKPLCCHTLQSLQCVGRKISCDFMFLWNWEPGEAASCSV